MQLIKLAENCFNNHSGFVHFIDDEFGNNLLNDLDRHSHIFFISLCDG